MTFTIRRSEVVISVASVAAISALSYYYFARISNKFKPSLLMRIIGAYGEDAEGTISTYHGVHHLPLIKVKTIVEGILGKVCSVKTFTFQLTDPNMILDKYIDLSAADIVKMHSIGPSGEGGGHKSYSPTDVSTPGFIDITVKIYPDGVNSQLFDKLKIGDTVGMSGPWPPSRMRKLRLPGKFVNIVSFGIGITEAIEVAKGEIQKKDAEHVNLLYLNRYREDAIFKQELAEMQAKHQNLFQLIYVYSREEQHSLMKEERSGRVNADLLQDVFDLPISSNDPNHCEQRFVIAGSRKMISDTWKHLSTFKYNRKDHSLLLMKLKFFGKSKERTQKMYLDKNKEL